MQIELAPEVEARVHAVADERGLTVSRLLEQLVDSADHALPMEASNADHERHAAIEEHIEWMKRTSPDWETADPYAVDWQAIKADGRKY